MIKLIKRIIESVGGSFNNNKDGSSARKLTSFWFVVLTSIIEFAFLYYVLKSCVDIVNNSNNTQFHLIIELLWLLIYICIINILLVLLLLGVITFEQIIKFKGGDDKAKQTDNNNNNSDLPTS